MFHPSLYLFPILSSFIFFPFVLATKVDSTCPKGWISDSNSRSCYYVARRRMTHLEAHQYCHRLESSSHLLRIECEGENEYINGLTSPSSSSAWIDTRARFDIVDSSAGLFAPGFVFRWPNGKIVRFTNWADENGVKMVSRAKKCVTQNSKGFWENTSCTELATVVCEKKLHRTYEKHCPKHWTHFNETGACYRAITRTNMTILDADHRCFQIGYEHNQDAMLASVSSEKENSFVEELVRQRNDQFDFAMLGGFGRSNNGNKWHRMDGSLFTYQNWDRGMPFGKKALAVLVMNRRGRWINHYADRILSQFNAVAVCKFKP